MEQQIVSNFSFLDGSFDELASIARKAELLFSVDVDSCAAKLRLFGELWLHEYNRIAGNKVRLSGTFGDLVAKALQERLISESHYELLEPLRSYGNLASHVRFSDLSQKANFRSITKTQLKSNFFAIMSLADALLEKAGVKHVRSSEWSEPVDLIAALDYQKAVYDAPESVIKIAQKHLADLAKLPHSKKRSDLVSINAKLADCDYWLMKSRMVKAELADFESYLFYKGHYHPEARNVSFATKYKKQAMLVDSSGQVHLFIAIEELNNQRFDMYENYIKTAIDKGQLEALNHYLSQLYIREKYSENFSKFNELGLARNHIPCLIALATNKILELSELSEEAVKPAHKEIKRILIKLKAVKSEAAKFAEALAVAVEPDGIFTSQHAKHLVHGAKSLPVYCTSSCATLYALYCNGYLKSATKQLVVQGLQEAEGSVSEGAVCFFAAMAILEIWLEKKIVLVPGLSTAKLIKKSATLGFQQAIDFEHETSEQAYKPRVIKNKRGIRKQNKAKRKQGRK